MKTNTTRIRRSVIAALGLTLLVGLVGLQTQGTSVTPSLLAETADEHAGHDHAAQAEKAHGEKGEADHDEKEGHDEKDEPDGDDHSAHAEKEAVDEHAGHDHAAPAAKAKAVDPHAGHDHGAEDKLSVSLTAAQRAQFGVVMARVTSGTLTKQIRLPGEIVVNGDQLAHVLPAANGITQKVNVSVGDTVKAGAILAVIDSAELSEAKTQYLATVNELQCCDADLVRSEALAASAKTLLATLDKSPTLEKLRSMKLAALGEGHAKLLAAYAEFEFARIEYDREKSLMEQKVSSRADFQTAASAYKKAYAEYIAAKDSLAYAAPRALQEVRRTRQNQSLALRASAQKLRVLGVSESEVNTLRKALQASAHPAGEKCADPSCANCVAKKKTASTLATVLDAKLGIYALRAPFAGTILQKDISLGEKVSSDAVVITLANLSTVWVDLSVYQKDLPFVQAGQRVHISLGKGSPAVEGKIAFVLPVVNSETRTALARIVLPNPKAQYRPGLFVTAEIDISAASIATLVPRQAVQRIEKQLVVFVPSDTGDKLIAQPVEIGRRSRTHVEVLKGLRAGQSYVAKGAFQLKAQIVTSGLGAHAGHGH